jgi:putative spermidine/putrescine transport system ATP-binding protein
MVKEFNELILKNLSKSFGNLKVLNDYNLVVKRGEFVTFLGPSGCGKSTALNCISGLQQIMEGEIYIDDECIDDSKKIFVPPEKRGFGIVFQNYALFPHLNVYKNVAFSLEIKKLPKNQIKERVEEALKMVHLEGYSDKFPSQLSGGQQQRVAIARCIIMEPRLLLLDEPLSNLDAKLRVEMRYELKIIHERLHIPTIYVTHDQEEALALSDRIVVMKIGEIQQVGTPEEIYSNPANQFVADFMGYKNIWPAKIKQTVENSKDLEIILDVNGIELKSCIKLSDINNANNKLIIDAYKNEGKVVAAIRPEDVSIGAVTTNTITCKVDIIEYLGTTNQVSMFSNNGLKIIARHTTKLNKGDMISYNLPPDKILIFPREDDEKI